MRTTMIVAAAVLTLSTSAALGQKALPGSKVTAAKVSEKPSASRPHEVDEKAIRAVVDAFAKAYNEHNAKAIGNLFTADAEIVNDQGEVKQGRAEIEQEFAETFDDTPETHISIAIKTIRFLGAAVAAEDGTATVVRAKGDAPARTRYAVMHVKQDGKWQMASARDLANEEPAGDAQLKELGLQVVHPAKQERLGAS